MYFDSDSILAPKHKYLATFVSMNFESTILPCIRPVQYRQQKFDILFSLHNKIFCNIFEYMTEKAVESEHFIQGKSYNNSSDSVLCENKDF